PRVSVTSTWSSPGRRSGSFFGLPMRNLPAGHQHSFTPAITRSWPAFEPSKSEGSSRSTTGAVRQQPSMRGTIRTSGPNRFALHMAGSPWRRTSHHSRPALSSSGRRPACTGDDVDGHDAIVAEHPEGLQFLHHLLLAGADGFEVAVPRFGDEVDL